MSFNKYTSFFLFTFIHNKQLNFLFTFHSFSSHFLSFNILSSYFLSFYFLLSSKQSLSKAYSCTLFTRFETWYFCFIESHMTLDVSLLRIIWSLSRKLFEKVNFLPSSPSNFYSSSICVVPLLALILLPQPISHSQWNSIFFQTEKIIHQYHPMVIMTIKLDNSRLQETTTTTIIFCHSSKLLLLAISLSPAVSLTLTQCGSCPINGALIPIVKIDNYHISFMREWIILFRTKRLIIYIELHVIQRKIESVKIDEKSCFMNSID
jgi:hypothetical protein